jgi:hypothetical protein
MIGKQALKKVVQLPAPDGSFVAARLIMELLVDAPLLEQVHQIEMTNVARV